LLYETAKEKTRDTCLYSIYIKPAKSRPLLFIAARSLCQSACLLRILCRRRRRFRLIHAESDCLDTKGNCCYHRAFAPPASRQQRSTCTSTTTMIMTTFLCLSNVGITTKAFLLRTTTTSRTAASASTFITTASAPCFSRSAAAGAVRTPSFSLICGLRLLSTIASKKEDTITEDTTTTGYDILNRKRGIDKYDPALFESEICKWWESTGCFLPGVKQLNNNKDDDNNKSHRTFCSCPHPT